jgi:predicted regulator of Ras-like GTPase activity (Roadblock/LC7/MglB family)
MSDHTKRKLYSLFEIFIPCREILSNGSFGKNIRITFEEYLKILKLEKFPSTPDSLDDLLNNLLNAVPEIEAAAIVSVEGLPIAFALSRDVDETKIAAMVATLQLLSKRVIIEMQKGDFDQLYIRGSDGYLLVLQAGPNAILMVSAAKDARLGLILLDCKNTCEKITGFKNRFPGTPFPYIPKHPSPPDDIDEAVQAQVIEKKKEEEYDIFRFCKHCGAPLDVGVSVCPNCKKKN